MKPASLAPESAFDQINGDEFKHSWICARHLASPSPYFFLFFFFLVGCAVQLVGSQYSNQELNPGPRH